MDTKQVIVLRQDLIKNIDGVELNKVISRAVNASISSLLKLFTLESITTLPGGILEPGQEYIRIYTQFGSDTVLSSWLFGEKLTKILCVPGEAELSKLYDRLCNSGDDFIPFALISESNLSNSGIPVNICLGIGPYLNDVIDKYLDGFPLIYSI